MFRMLVLDTNVKEVSPTSVTNICHEHRFNQTNLISECFDFLVAIHKTVLPDGPFLFKSQWLFSFKNLNFVNEADDAV